MKKFDFYSPTTVEEAVELLDKYKENAAVIAGGTDVLIELKEKHRKPDYVVDITRIKELDYVREEGGMIRIGALTTFGALEHSEFVKAHLPALFEMADYVGSPQIRNLGTIGGNVVNASVAGDSPTVFLAYDAEVVLKSKSGERVMTLEDFNKGPGNCAIRKDELLTEVRFPVLGENESVAYYKIGRRKALAIVVLAVSVYIKKGSDNKVEDCKVVLGAVNKHPMRSATIEKALIGLELTQEALDSTLPLFTQEVQHAIANRPSVVYKREGVRGAARECFKRILKQLA